MPPVTVLRQPTHREALIPVTNRIDEFGARGLKTRITLWLAAGAGLEPAPLKFLVDSGSSFSMISLGTAERNGIPVPLVGAEFPFAARTAAGLISVPVRPGRMRLWWTPNCVGYPFDWPVLFRLDAPGLDVPPLIGLASLFQTCRWTFDGTSTLAFPNGHLALDDVR